MSSLADLWLVADEEEALETGDAGAGGWCMGWRSLGAGPLGLVLVLVLVSAPAQVMVHSRQVSVSTSVNHSVGVGYWCLESIEFMLMRVGV